MSLSMKRILIVLSVAANIATGQQKKRKLKPGIHQVVPAQSGVSDEASGGTKWEMVDSLHNCEVPGPTRVRASGLGNGIRTGLGGSIELFGGSVV